MLGFLRHHGEVEQAFDLVFRLIRQLAAGGVEEFDAIVLISVVRRADDDAEAAFQALRHIRDARRRQRADQHDIDPRGDESRLQGGLEHVSGDACVLADQHASAARSQHSRGGARQAERKIHGHGRLTDTAAHTVGAEIFVQLSVPCTALTMPMASYVAATSWVRTIRAPFITASAASPKPPYSRSSTDLPRILPMKLLRDTPTSSGAPSAAKRESSFSSVKLCASPLPKPIPGSSAIASGAMPASMQAARSRARNAHTSAATSWYCGPSCMVRGSPC